MEWYKYTSSLSLAGKIRDDVKLFSYYNVSLAGGNSRVENDGSWTINIILK